MSFFEAIQSRRSVYRLTNTSPIPDSRIQEIVTFTVTHAPSAFNVQSARAVVLFREQHEKLWDVGLQVIQNEMPPAARPVLESKVAGLRAAYGSVCFYILFVFGQGLLC
jgi:predicted oxidoreductase (fatty acid repression mutant protein)